MDVMSIYHDRGIQLMLPIAPHLVVREVICRCPGACGNHAMDWLLLHCWASLRVSLNNPIVITSGFRCPRHPVEDAKAAPGMHSYGAALDMAWPRGVDKNSFHKMVRANFPGGVGVYGWGVHADVGKRRDW